MGEITACFNTRRNWPEKREKLVMEAIGAERMSAKRFSSTVGMGSKRLDLFWREGN